MGSLNASPMYFAAEQRYTAAKTPAEKLAALQEMLSAAPKHKGSENLRREITRKIAAVRSEIDKQKATKKGSGPQMHVKKEGAGQVVLIGLPNTGKTLLMNKVTGLDFEVANYPFTTTSPQFGMMNYRGALVQMVDLPALIEGSSKGKADGSQILSIVRNADAVVVLARNDSEKNIIISELANANIKLNLKKPAIIIKHSKYKGITISGTKFLKVKEKDFIEFLKQMGYHNAEVTILEDIIDMRQVIDALDDRLVYKNAIFVNVLSEYFDLEKTKEEIFLLLDKILVYTKPPGKDPDMSTPLVLKKGATVKDVARQLHKEFAQKLKYVRVWGSSKFAGQRVSHDYVLQNGDIIEISA